MGFEMDEARAAAVACALHGERAAGPGEIGCDGCGRVVCEHCEDRGLCDACRDEMEQEANARAEYEYQEWARQQEEEEHEREEERKRTNDAYTDFWKP